MTLNYTLREGLINDGETFKIETRIDLLVCLAKVLSFSISSPVLVFNIIILSTSLEAKALQDIN